MAFGKMLPIHEVTAPSMRAFATRHGYEFVVGERFDNDRPPNWSKVVLLQRLLDRYDWVFFLDADAIVLDLSEDPIGLLPDSAFQALALERNTSPNAGVWLVRSTDRARAFLDTVWNQEDFIDHPWSEQAAAMHLLGFQPDSPHRKVADTAWSDATYWLPQEWNSVVLYEGLVPCRIRHYAGMPDRYRLRRLQLDLSSLEEELGVPNRSARLRRFLSERHHAVTGAIVGRPHSPQRNRLKRRVKAPLVKWFPWLHRIRRTSRERGRQEQGPESALSPRE